MKKKLLATIGGSVLSAMLLVGCANDQEPPPEDEMNVEENMGDEDMDNGGIDDNGNINDEIDNNDLDMDMNENDENMDMNTGENGDMMQDENTPEEDIVEDPADMQDENDKDK